VKLCCNQVNLLSRASLNFKDSFVVSKKYLHSLQVDLSLIRDHLGTDPGITYIPLRSTWEGIVFIRGTITNNFSQLSSSSLILQQGLSVKALISTTLSSFPPPMLVSKVHNIVDNKFTSISPNFNSFSLQLREIETVVLTELASLRALYSVCSGGSSKPSEETIASHFTNMLQRISVLEMNRSSSVGSLAHPP